MEQRDAYTPEMDARTFSVNLRRQRIQQGLSVKDLSKRAGVAHKTIYRIEQQETHHLQTRTALKLAEALGLTPLELFGERPGLIMREPGSIEGNERPTDQPVENANQAISVEAK
jgi:transcriptional regulator with XRE-family HTH domain